jgi:hypothetical protein
VQCDIAERDTVVSEANIDCMRPYSKVFTRTDCGYAAIDVMNRKLDDRMDSFFLSETIKYLFLIFDEHNAANGPNIVFTTEGHLFPVDRLQTRRIAQVQVTSTHTHTHTLSLSLSLCLSLSLSLSVSLSLSQRSRLPQLLILYTHARRCL